LTPEETAAEVLEAVGAMGAVAQVTKVMRIARREIVIRVMIMMMKGV
jgi:hypothetical protein